MMAHSAPAVALQWQTMATQGIGFIGLSVSAKSLIARGKCRMFCGLQMFVGRRIDDAKRFADPSFAV